MADIYFEPDGKARFPTKYHGESSLSKAKWEQICGQPERYYYHLNGDKVATTLVAPDMVRHHISVPTQFIYYKRFDRFTLGPGIEAAVSPKLMAVVIDTATQRVCTVYPTDKPKADSQEYKPNA